MALNFARRSLSALPDGGRISFGTVCPSSHLQAGPMWERVLSSTGWWDGRTLPMWRSPGKTTQVNYFLIDRRAYLVDLPGYGYARVSQAEKERWAKLMESYFQEEADRITTGVLIVDIRHKPTANDLVMHDWFRQTGCPEIVVANKLDKLKKEPGGAGPSTGPGDAGADGGGYSAPLSAEKGMGKEDLIRLLVQTCGG